MKTTCMSIYFVKSLKLINRKLLFVLIINVFMFYNYPHKTVISVICEMVSVLIWSAVVCEFEPRRPFH